MVKKQKSFLGFGSGLLLGIVGYHLFLQIRKKHTRPLNVIKYVFVKHNGKPFTLTDREMYDIKHKYEDGVLVSAIAQDYGIDAVTICRIINYINCFKFNRQTKKRNGR